MKQRPLGPRSRLAALMLTGVATGAALGLAPLSSVEVSAEAGASSCESQTLETRVDNQRAAVLVSTERIRTYLCDQRTGKKVSLGPRPSNDAMVLLGGYALSRNFVAYQVLKVPNSRFGTKSYSLVLRRSPSATLVWRTKPFDTAGSPVRGPAGDDGIKALVVDDAGRLAWIARNPYNPRYRFEVRRVEADGALTVLDEGNEIETDSLELGATPGVIAWRKAGKRKTARLAGPDLDLITNQTG